MLKVKDGNEEFKIKFEWGDQKGIGRINKDIQFYNSFILEDVEYFLYDCVYFYRTGDPETSIGKLVKIYETPTHEKKVKVVWLFRPIEIRNFLGDYEFKWNELFLASGHGTGLSNINPLESIVRKCNVVCTSKDQRNPQASEAELRMADYIFCRTFNVGKLIVEKNFADKIDGVKVEHYFNKKKNQKLINPPNLETNVKECTEKSSFSSKLGLDKVVGSTVKDGMSGSKVLSPVVKESKNAAVRLGELGHIRPPKKRKSLLDDKETKISDKEALQSAQDRNIKTNSQLEEVTRGPGAEKRNWFKQLPWEERLQKAHEEGTLVSLKNLDPSFTSSEVEDLVWHAFKERVEAKVIQRSTFSSPHNGEALVLFKSKEAAESAISKLGNRCLMLADGRSVVGCRATLREPRKPASFVGHLTVDKSRFQRQREEMRTAVSTSHCSQPNNLEYDMALDWCILQEKSDRWWNALHERQAKEIQKVMSLLKMNRDR